MKSRTNHRLAFVATYTQYVAQLALIALKIKGWLVWSWWAVVAPYPIAWLSVLFLIWLGWKLHWLVPVNR